MQTDNLELKKLVYLYLMNYAKSQPDMAIMAVNSFVKVRLAVIVWINLIINVYEIPPDCLKLFFPFFFRTVRIRTH